jgi:hypothetical protein
LIGCAMAGPLENERCQQRECGKRTDDASFQVGKSFGV